MSSTLAPAMARTGLDALLARLETQTTFTSEQARELLAACEMGDLFVKKLWQLIQGSLDRGTEGGRFRALLKETADVIDVAVKVFGFASERLKTAAVTPTERAEGMATLEQATRQAEAMRQEVSHLLRWLERPPKPIDPSILRADRGDPAAKGYIDLDELTKRLLSGEDA